MAEVASGMIEFDPSPGSHINEACRIAAVLAKSSLADANPDQVGAYYAVHLDGDDATLALGPWYLPDGCEERYEGSAFWDHVQTRGVRGVVLCRRVDGDAGVRATFNDVTVMCPHGDPRPIDDLASALVQDWNEQRQTAYDAYWTPERQAERDRREAEHAAKMDERRQACDRARSEYPFYPTDPDTYAEYKSLNASGYGGAVVRYAEDWAALMEKAIAEVGLTVADAAEHTHGEADYDGITGFMYGCAVRQLVQWWKHGEALRVWHNAKYNHAGDGVVNPAILTFKAD